jgi:tellurite resistance protein
MKRIIVMLGIMAVAATLAGAQEAVRNQLAKRLGLTEQQADTFIAIYDDSAVDLAKARAEVNVQKAQLAKLLLDVDVSDRDVEKVLRQAVDAEVQVRMIQIHRELAARKLIGERRWIQLREMLRRLAEAKVRASVRNAPARQAAGDGELDPKEQALLQELADLVGE